MPPINPPVFDAVSAYGIGGLAVTVATAFMFMVARGLGRWPMYRVIAVGAVCMVGTALLAAFGGLSDADFLPPPMAIMIMLVFVLALSGGLGPLGTHLMHGVPLLWLIGLQAFRLPLELVMHHASDVGIMPVALSYSGYNFDILTGIGAVLLFGTLKMGVRVHPIIIWLWNLLGIYCLIAIAIIAIATSPMVHALGTDPSNMNTWVLFFPYIWLPVVMVTIAIISHIVITRQLLHATRGHQSFA